MSKKRRNGFIAGGLIVGSLALAALLVGSRSAPPRTAPPIRTPSVETVSVREVVGPLTIRGGGAVRPKAEIDLAPQVSGRISYVSPSMVSGGRVRAGEVLVSIDPADYENRVLQVRAQVAQDSVGILQAEEEARIAQAEYNQFVQRQRRMSPPAGAIGANESNGGEPSRLALREPQLQAARASLARSKAQLADAELALSRTVLRAPFDGVVRSESVDVGAYAVPGQPLARLLSTDEVEVTVPLSSDDASLLPGLWSLGDGSERRLPARIIADFGPRAYRWEAYVHRAEAALDEQTRTLDIVVRVPSPFVGAQPMYEAQEQAFDAPPLLVGQFVDVELDGMEGEYLLVPRRAVRPGNEVWIAEEGTIRIVPVQVLQRSEGEAYVAGDLTPGQRVVVAGIDLATEGMAVQDRGEGLS